MSIHAKSLNQLAYELEELPDLQCLEQPTERNAVSTIKSDEASNLLIALHELKGWLTAELDKSEPTKIMAAKAHTSDQRRLPIPNATTAHAIENTQRLSDADFLAGLDGTMGLRNRIEDRVAVRKGESTIRLYSGFASRRDIAGRD